MVHVKLTSRCAQMLDTLTLSNEGLRMEAKKYLHSEWSAWIEGLSYCQEKEVLLKHNQQQLVSLQQDHGRSGTPSLESMDCPSTFAEFVERKRTAMEAAQREWVVRNAHGGTPPSSSSRSLNSPIGQQPPLYTPSFLHQDVVLVPLNLIQQAAVVVVEPLLTTSTPLEAILSCSGGLIICPSQLPPNPNRREKNKRLRQIEKAVENQEYNRLLTSRQEPTNPFSTKGSESAKLHVADLRGPHRRGGRHAGGDDEPPKKETFSVFMKDVAVGLDIRLMSLAGGVVGYYLYYIRGKPFDECIVAAAVGAVFMMFVDAVLLVLRMRREDSGGGGDRARTRKNVAVETKEDDTRKKNV